MDNTAETSPVDISYQPTDVAESHPIALVGCGGITRQHLDAYTNAGFEVVAFCDIDEATAKERRDEFYPEADVYTDAQAVYARDDVEVVDIATHPEPRVALIEDAIEAGKHVLSQKPFVLDLDTGERLVELAEDAGVTLAVNQNGRWASHYSYIRNAVAEGYVGDVLGAHIDVHWDHDGWLPGTPFDEIPHAILYDYGIHGFDLMACLFEERTPKRISASVSRSPSQQSKPPMLAQAILEYEDAQASLVFDGSTTQGAADRTYVAGTDGTVESNGPELGDQRVTLHTDDESTSPALEGDWFPVGMEGAMSELLAAIEADREPSNSARNNIRSLELCFAACASAEDGEPKVPGEVRSLPTGDPEAL